METPNRINNIHDAINVLSEKTEQLLNKYDNGEKINIAAESQISKRFDTLARNSALLIKYRKQTGSEEPIWFFTNT